MSDDEGDYGPPLPPELLAQRAASAGGGGGVVEPAPVPASRKPIVGPAMPSRELLELAQQLTRRPDGDEEEGPEAPDRDGDDDDAHREQRYDEDDDDVVGPRLGEAAGDWNEEEERLRAVERFVNRESAHKRKIDEETNKKEARGEWMLKPPELKGIQASASMQNRSFSTKKNPLDLDSTLWTETPAEREKRLRERLPEKRKHKEEEEGPSQRDVETARRVAAYNDAKRPRTLVEEHAAKLSKEKAAAGPEVRKPFDYERDILGGGKTAAKNAVEETIKKAAGLDSKFSHGKSMFM